MSAAYPPKRDLYIDISRVSLYFGAPPVCDTVNIYFYYQMLDSIHARVHVSVILEIHVDVKIWLRHFLNEKYSAQTVNFENLQNTSTYSYCLKKKYCETLCAITFRNMGDKKNPHRGCQILSPVSLNGKMAYAVLYRLLQRPFTKSCHHIRQWTKYLLARPSRYHLLLTTTFIAKCDTRPRIDLQVHKKVCRLDDDKFHSLDHEDTVYVHGWISTMDYDAILSINK